MILDTVSSAVLPLIVLGTATAMLSRRTDYFSVFLCGAREGLAGAVRLIPTMVALCVALSMLTASGAIDSITALVRAPAEAIGIPPEVLPLALTRPVSGSASTATLSALFDACGTDSFPALCASVLMGSSDTVVYILSVYFSGARGVRHTRYAVFVAAVGAVLAVFLSCTVTRLFFPSLA